MAADAKELFAQFETVVSNFKDYKRRSRAERQHLTELNTGLEQQLASATEARRELESRQRRTQAQLVDLQVQCTHTQVMCFVKAYVCMHAHKPCIVFAHVIYSHLT